MSSSSTAPPSAVSTESNTDEINNSSSGGSISFATSFLVATVVMIAVIAIIATVAWALEGRFNRHRRPKRQNVSQSETGVLPFLQRKPELPGGTVREQAPAEETNFELPSAEIAHEMLDEEPGTGEVVDEWPGEELEGGEVICELEGDGKQA